MNSQPNVTSSTGTLKKCFICKKPLLKFSYFPNGRTDGCYHEECQKSARQGSKGGNIHISLVCFENVFFGLKNVTFYVFNLMNGNNFWILKKRFTEFYELDVQLNTLVPNKTVLLDVKKDAFMTHAKMAVRSNKFLEYLIAILNDTALSQLPCVIEFIKPTIEKVIERCCEILTNATEVGLFKVNGSVSSVKRIRDNIEKNLPIDLKPYETDLCTIASVLKAIFMAPTGSHFDALIYPSLNDEYTEKYGAYDWKDKSNFDVDTNKKPIGLMTKEKVKEVVQLLPAKIKMYFYKLIRLLYGISMSPTTVMNIDNLKVILNQTLQLPPKFLHTLIEHYNFIFT